MYKCKTTIHKMCHQYSDIGSLSASIKHSEIYDDFDAHKKVELVKLLDELRSYLFDKIES